MLTWLLLVPVVVLFVTINLVVGCYFAVRCGYGPPDWKTALNLAVRVTTLQDRLNAGRDWLAIKAPRVDKFLDRLLIPKPIIIVDMPERQETNDEVGEMKNKSVSEQADEFTGGAFDGLLDELAPHATESERAHHSVSANTDKNRE